MSKDQLILDMSYYMHYLSHSAFNAIKAEFPFPENQEELYQIDLSQHDEYIAKLKEKVFGVLYSLMKQYDCEDCRPIACLDCSKKDIWRKAIYDDYKLPRMVAKQSGINKGHIFKWAKEHLYPVLEEKHNFIMVDHPKGEGDDCVAIVKTVLRKLNPDSNIFIIASDRDLLQLIDENCYICSLDGKLLNEESMGKEKDLLYKTLIGDISDNIPKCFDKVAGDPVLSRGFGEKACMKLLEDSILLEKKLQEFPSAVTQMEKNRILVDFKHIPKDIKEDIARNFLKKYR